MIFFESESYIMSFELFLFSIQLGILSILSSFTENSFLKFSLSLSVRVTTISANFAPIHCLNMCLFPYVLFSKFECSQYIVFTFVPFAANIPTLLTPAVIINNTSILFSFKYFFTFFEIFNKFLVILIVLSNIFTYLYSLACSSTLLSNKLITCISLSLANSIAKFFATLSAPPVALKSYTKIPTFFI